MHDVISKEDALRILGHHLDDIITVVTAGWTDWKGVQQEAPRWALRKSARTRASWVNDAMAEKAREVFADKPGVHMTEKRGFITLTFENTLILRFKKFRGKRLRTSGIPTQQRLDFENQQVAIEGITVTSIVAGYLLDRLELEQERLAITCPLGGENLWVIELEIPGGEVRNVTFGPPAAPSTPGVVVESATAGQEEEQANQED
ncbi:hypothetical protein JOL79_11185 [Microbispora sp. RL4-1S]|uniref:Uncharacterized protein n=1 Tax=Microbispora oryzae TaxID=2806554 RepID=A0A940WNQ9_9ACTN|nr:hypothetical protein [Microbispora oryzae]MBP2704376.1 hypothetical protein [Microbispora oryzae]